MAIKPINVTQLNKYIASILRSDPHLGNLVVQGEMSRIVRHKNGNIYFALKDSQSVISCTIFKSDVSKLRYELEEGMAVIITGYLNVYVGGGSYSLNVTSLEMAGMGSLAAAFEKLKQKLAEEGLFDPAYKKPLPKYPNKVAIVTSDTGAAVRDICKILTTRSQTVDILIYPVLVQGPGAAAEISAALYDINENMDDVDVIICGRGGGSVENLWAFNEEPVARAIFASEIPVISGVGHEIDVTIADYVADVRAETPTAAAQMAVPVTSEILEALDDFKIYFSQRMQHILQSKERVLAERNMDTLTLMMRQRIQLSEMQADSTKEHLKIRMDRLLLDWETTLSGLGMTLESHSPKRTMERGYVAMTDENGNMIRNITSLSEGDRLHIVGADGVADVTVDNVTVKQ